MRRYAYEARASWLDDDGRQRVPDLPVAGGAVLEAASIDDAAASAAGALECAHRALVELGSPYPPLEEAELTVRVKAAR